MIGRDLLIAVLACACGDAAMGAELSSAGTDLGRIKASQTSAGLAVTVDVTGSQPTSSFIVARFPDNHPLMRGADGLWAPWDGNDASLSDAGVPTAGGTMTFAIADQMISDVAFPVIFTVGYKSMDGLRFGYIAVDEP